MNHILCPSCCELAPASARRCRHCSELLRDYQECPDCRERVRAEAGTCRFCGRRLLRPTPPPLPKSVPKPENPVSLPIAAAASGPAPAEDYTVGATPLRGLFAERSVSALFSPAELRLNAGIVTLRRFFGLGGSSTTERIPVSRIKAVHVVRGTVSSVLRIVDVGGGPGLELGGLRKNEAAAMAELLKRAAERAVRPAAPVSSVSSSATSSESSRVL